MIPRLTSAGEVYLDHSGTTIPAASLLKKHYEVLTSNVYGNPHSRSHSSQRTTKYIEKARHQVLQLFNATTADYEIVFTQNTTQAVKLVAEGLCSTYDKGWGYAYSEDSHTSLIGLRELSDHHTTFSKTSYGSAMENLRSSGPLLVSWPGQSNFSGERFLDKAWHPLAKSVGNDVFTLLDAAGLVTTHMPDLSNAANNPLAADFICLSFYKIFGFPDLGALLVKKDSPASSLFTKRKYFGGGTVESLTFNTKFAPRKSSLSSQLEDGTIPFHSIIALSLAIDTHMSLYSSFEAISKHTSVLSNYTYQQLKLLKHENGQPLCEIYSTGSYLDRKAQGPIVSFNLRDSEGAWIGYSKFEEICLVESIDIRCGTMCNTGGSSRAIGYTEEDIISNHTKGHICGDTMDVINGKPTGAIRVSLGAMSSVEDVNALIQCLQKYFIDSCSQNSRSSILSSSDSTYIKAILVYPIKSCGSFSVPESINWTLLPRGLQWDREFCVVSTLTGNILSLKKYPEMANIRPFLNLEKGIMEVTYEGLADLKGKKCIIVPLSAGCQSHSQEMMSRLCGERIQTTPLDSAEVMEFFSEILQVPCTLARSSANTRFYKPHLDGPLDFSTNRNVPIAEKKITISMNNSSPLLLLSESSVRELNNQRESSSSRSINPAVFRGNIIVDGVSLAPYAEDTWHNISIGNTSVYNVSEVLHP